MKRNTDLNPLFGKRGGWLTLTRLTLTRLGLAPGKKHQALLWRTNVANYPELFAVHMTVLSCYFLFNPYIVFFYFCL